MSKFNMTSESNFNGSSTESIFVLTPSQDFIEQPGGLSISRNRRVDQCISWKEFVIKHILCDKPSGLSFSWKWNVKPHLHDVCTFFPILFLKIFILFQSQVTNRKVKGLRLRLPQGEYFVHHFNHNLHYFPHFMKKRKWCIVDIAYFLYRRRMRFYTTVNI